MTIVLQKLKKIINPNQNQRGRIIAIRSNGLQVSITNGKAEMFPYQTGFKVGDQVLKTKNGLIKAPSIAPTREYEV